MTIKHVLLGLTALLSWPAAFADAVCNNVPEWNPDTAYTTPGERVQFSKKEYKNLYWTQGNEPDQGGSWVFVDNCQYLPTLHDTVSLTLSHPPAGPIAFTDTVNNKHYVVKPGQTTLTLPYTEPTTYQITTEGGTLSPAAFVAEQNTDYLSLTFTPYKSNKVLAGYVTASWGSPLTISDAAGMGYNIALVAFGEINDTDISLLQDQFIGYTHWNSMTADTQAAIRADIIKARQTQGLQHVILSLGGQNGQVVLPTSKDEQTLLAKNTIDLLNTYGFDGIDFDMENAVGDYGASMAQFIAVLKGMTLADGEAPVVTAAPQLNSIAAEDNTKVSIVSTSTSQDYNQAIVDGDFDFLFIQAYNTGPKTNVIDGFNEGDPQYISKSISYLEAGYPGQLNSSAPIKTLTIPAQTKIVVGEPATTGSAGDVSIFTGPASGAPYDAMYKEFSALQGNTQYGGAMVWSINDDFSAGCPLSSKIAPITSDTYVSCPMK